MNLGEHGFTTLRSTIPEIRLADLRDSLFAESSAGERCLLHLVYHTGTPIPETLHRAV